VLVDFGEYWDAEGLQGRLRMLEEIPDVRLEIETVGVRPLGRIGERIEPYDGGASLRQQRQVLGNEAASDGRSAIEVYLLLLNGNTCTPLTMPLKCVSKRLVSSCRSCPMLSA